MNKKTKKHRSLSKICRSGIIRGSILIMRRKCGKENCKCNKDTDYKHTSLYLVQKTKGKQRMIYIPKSWETKVKGWVNRYHELYDAIEELSEESWEKLINREK